MGQAVGGRALAVEYRRAPEHVFPAAVADCTTAYRWLLEQGIAPGRIVFFGDSAGGNLCVSTALLAREQGLPVPAALVPISPGAVDLTEEVPPERRALDPFSRIDNRPRMLDAYLRGADPAHPLASPLYADLSGLPPMLVLVGPDEACLDVSVELVRRAVEQGGEATCEVVDGAFHTWLGYWGRVPEADAAIERIAAFVRERVAALT
jgi:acetyl esterase/lipase